jgi:hypothetical protein
VATGKRDSSGVTDKYPRDDLDDDFNNDWDENFGADGNFDEIFSNDAVRMQRRLFKCDEPVVSQKCPRRY